MPGRGSGGVFLTRDERDTIAAIASPPGRGGIGIVRISGPAVQQIATEIIDGKLRARHAHLKAFRDQHREPIDRGIALYFPVPGSYTGEDMLELQAHGSPLVLDMLLERVLDVGARLARPGEFTERAFLNERLDLSQAEAVADLIDSASRAAARSAQRSLEGAFSRDVNALVAELIDLRAFVEAAIDFPEEEIDFLSGSDVTQRLSHLHTELTRLMASAQQGVALREGLSVVIAGRPNVGKSTLLNRLVGRDAAIVADTPGTTRDALHEELQIDGLPLHIVDTAGLRETSDAVEALGIERTWAHLRDADVVLLVIDDAHGVADPSIVARLPAGLKTVRVMNKIDLTGGLDGKRSEVDGLVVGVSATTGAGIDALRECLKAQAGYQSAAEGVFIARRRHLDALSAAERSLQAGVQQLNAHHAAELLAEDLRAAQHALGLITGAVTNDDLLGHIFSSFCIGK